MLQKQSKKQVTNFMAKQSDGGYTDSQIKDIIQQEKNDIRFKEVKDIITGISNNFFRDQSEISAVKNCLHLNKPLKPAQPSRIDSFWNQKRWNLISLNSRRHSSVEISANSDVSTKQSSIIQERSPYRIQPNKTNLFSDDLLINQMRKSINP